MGQRKRYVKRADQAVVAVQLALDTQGFTYKKWGAEQRCKAGDWLLNNGGDVYTVDETSFARTYREVSPGRFVKATPVWAEVADAAGSVRTKEGQTGYVAGDYLVFNDGDGDPYAVSKAAFERMYEPTD